MAAKLLAPNDGLVVPISRKSEMPRHPPLEVAWQILHVLSLNPSPSAPVNKVFGLKIVLDLPGTCTTQRNAPN
jgi:hypothetical protein